MSKYVDLAGRLLLCAMFFMAGIDKIGAYAGTQGYMESQGVPGFLLVAVIFVEVVGSVAVAIGWQVRIAAMALAGFSLLAALLFHWDPENQMQMIMFMKNTAIAGGFLMVAAHGAGEFSLDHHIATSRSTEAQAQA